MCRDGRRDEGQEATHTRAFIRRQLTLLVQAQLAALPVSLLDVVKDVTCNPKAARPVPNPRRIGEQETYRRIRRAIAVGGEEI